MPALEYRTIINESGGSYVNRLLVGTAVTGLVRVEWLQARIGQIIPVNWSWVQMWDYMNGYMPLHYQVADAQNLIVKQALESDFQWLLLWEHDNVPLPDALVRLNEHIINEKAPVVSGLYYTRSEPSEPLVFRGRGTGTYRKWKPGDLVYCDGVPTGFLLIQCGLLRAMWEDSEEYTVRGQVTRRVFEHPQKMWYDPEQMAWNIQSGTSDLEWCNRVMRGDYLRKAGWGDYVDSLPDPRYPFIVDTNIFTWHYNPDGSRFPREWPPKAPVEASPPPLGISVSDGVKTGERMD